MHLRLSRRWGTTVGLLGMLSCAPAVTTKPKPTESRATVSVVKTGSSAPTLTANPTIVPRVGRGKLEVLPDVRGVVSGIQRTRDATYLRIRSGESRLALGLELESALAECEPRIKCLAALRVDVEGKSETGTARKSSGRQGMPKRVEPRGSRDPEVLVRIVDPAAVAGVRSVSLSVLRKNRGGLVQTLVAQGLESAAPETDLEREFASSWADQVRRMGEGEPFADFAAARIEQRQAMRGRVAQANATRSTPRSSLLDLMDFYTGRAEVQRTLQTDRGLGTGLRALPKSIDIGNLRGVDHVARDYGKIFAGSTDVERFVPHTLADSLPADALVIEFPSIQELLTLPHSLDAKLGMIVTALEGQAGTLSLIEHYRSQLILEQTVLAEKLGYVAIGSVALAIGDPYLREGTDVSLLFEVRDRKLLELALLELVARARLVHPEIEVRNLVIADAPVALYATPDGRIRRYEAWVGSELVLSNSRASIERILEVRRNKVPRLSASADYRWARSIAPYSAEKERAFLFFGDAFVDKVTGPRSKILEARRALAQSELRSVEYAALLFGWMQGRVPSSLDELLESGWLTKRDLRHFDGSPIAYDVKSGASSRFGAADQLLPIVDLGIERIDKDEAAAYEGFRDRYERGLRGALDPTSLRFLRTPNDQQWSTELRILPLAPSGEIGSQFREIVRTVGRGAVDLGRTGSGLRAVLGVSQESPLRDLANGAARGTIRTRERLFGFLGDWIEVGVEDSPWLWNFAYAERMLPEIDGPLDDRSSLGFEQNVHRLPLWMSAQVKSPVVLAAALAALRMQSRESLGDWVTWHDGERFGEIAITRVEIRPNGSEIAPIMIHFAVVKDVLVLSLERSLLETRIQKILAGERPKVADPSLGTGQLVVDYKRGASIHLRQLLAAWLEEPAMLTHRRACIGLTMLAAGIGEEAANSSDRAAVAQRVLGYVPGSPGGAGLSVIDGQCHHPVYGTLLEPIIPDGRDDRLPLHDAITRLAALRFGLAVIPRADEQEFVGRVDLDWN